MTPIKTISNRMNAKKSTGPNTPAGKNRSSLNSLRHGLTAQIVVMPSEDLEAYQRHLKSFTDEYHPQGATESHLVQSLADASWRLNRLAALETNLLTLAFATPAPLEDATPTAALDTHSKALANLSMHSQRLSRQFERTVTQLRDLQKTRQSQEELEMKHLLDIMEMYKFKEEPWLPSEVGFVFSPAQIDDGVLARRRENLFMKAFRSEKSPL